MWPDALRLLPLAPGVSRSFRGVPPLPAAGVEVVEPTEGEGDGGARARLVPPVSLEAAADMLLAKAACCLSNEFILSAVAPNSHNGSDFSVRRCRFRGSLSLLQSVVFRRYQPTASEDGEVFRKRSERGALVEES